MGNVVEHENLLFGVSFDDQLALLLLRQIDALAVLGLGSLGLESDDHFDLLLTVYSTVSTHL